MLRWVSVAPLGNPVVPDVYWMLIGSSGRRLRRPAGHGRRVGATGTGDELVPLVLPEEHRPLQAGHLAVDLVDHLHVVGALERRGGEEHPAARLVEGVGQLVGAVRRVDVDEDHADVGGGVLQQRPLGVVRAPQSDPVADLQAESEQPGAEPLDPLAELGVGPADALVAGDEGVVVAVGGDRPPRGCRRSSRRAAATSVGPRSMASSAAMPRCSRVQIAVTASRRRGVDDERLPRRHR